MGAFDDLIPGQSKNAFADLVPGENAFADLIPVNRYGSEAQAGLQLHDQVVGLMHKAGNMFQMGSQLPRMADQQKLRGELQQLREQGPGELYEGGVGSQIGIGLRQGLSTLGQGGYGVIEGLAGLGRRVTPIDVAVEKLSSGRLLGPFGIVEAAAARGRHERSEDVAAHETVGRATGGPTAARQLAAMTSSLAPSIAAAPLGFGAMVASAGLQSFGGKYAELQEDVPDFGPNFVHALNSGGITAATTAFFGRTGVERLADPAVRSLVKKTMLDYAKKNAGRYGKDVVFESFDEGADTLLNNIYTKYSHNPDISITDGLALTMAGGALLGGMAGAPAFVGQTLARPVETPFTTQEGTQPGDTALMAAAAMREGMQQTSEKIGRLQDRLAELEAQGGSVANRRAKFALVRIQQAQEHFNKLKERGDMLEAQAISRRITMEDIPTLESPYINITPEKVTPGLVTLQEVREGKPGNVVIPEGTSLFLGQTPQQQNITGRGFYQHEQLPSQAYPGAAAGLFPRPALAHGGLMTEQTEGLYGKKYVPPGKRPYQRKPKQAVLPTQAEAAERRYANQISETTPIHGDVQQAQQGQGEVPPTKGRKGVLKGGPRSEEVGDQRVFSTETEQILPTLGFKSGKAVDGTQLWNRIKNKTVEGEVALLESVGFDKWVKGGKRTVEEAQQWLKENGPRVDVVTYGMEGKVSEAKREFARMTHEWYERLGQQDKQRIENAIAYERYGRPVDYENELAAMGSKNSKLAQDYLRYKKIIEEGPKGLKATSYYKQVSATLAEKNARDVAHDKLTIDWLAKQPQHIRDVVEARLEKAAGGARMEDVLKQHKQDNYAKGSERENEVTSNNPEHYIERNYDGSYYVNQNPHVGIADTRILGKRYATKEEAIQAARKLHGLLSEADGVAINKYVDATLKQEESGAMPWWTRSAIEARKVGQEAPTNVQRVDVVIPQRLKKTAEELADENKQFDEALARLPDEEMRRDIGRIRPRKEFEPLWTQDNIHENLPNTLGWAMVQYKTGPKGEKIAVIVEAQSRWAQVQRKQLNQKKSDATGHPLLRDHLRLIAKAVIDQAWKENATHIGISDAETVMLSERHDQMASMIRLVEVSEVSVGSQEPTRAFGHDWEKGSYAAVEQNDGSSFVLRIDKPEVNYTTRIELATAIAKEYPLGKGLTSKSETPYIKQEGGMRLNYDKILPEIAQQLTGSKPEKVELGEHKNVRLESGEMRPNLLFGGKTTVTANLFPIAQPAARRNVGEPFTLTRKAYAQPSSLTPEEQSVLSRIGLDKPNQTAVDVLPFIIENAPDSDTRALATLLLENFPADVLGKIPFVIDKEAHGSFYDWHERTISIALKGNPRPALVLHEIAHALTMHVMSDPQTKAQKELVSYLQALRKRSMVDHIPEHIWQSRSQFNKAMRDWVAHDDSSGLDAYEEQFGLSWMNIMYGLHSEFEMVAQVFDSPSFRTFLNSIPDGPVSVLQRIQTFIKKALGIRQETALEGLLERIMEVGREGGPFSAKSGDKVIKAAPTKKDVKPFVTDIHSMMPDFHDNLQEANDLFSTKFGMDRIPTIPIPLTDIRLNPWGGKARIETPQDAAAARWYAEKNSVGPAIAASYGASISGQVNSVFDIDKDGNITNIGAVVGKSRKAGDVFETLQRNSNAYRLNKEQRKVWDEVLKPLAERKAFLLNKYKLLNTLDENGDPIAHFPRVVVKFPKTRKGDPSSGSGRFGAKQPFQHRRAFDKSEQEGWDAGYKYSTDIEARMVYEVERIYRAIADQRLIKDPALKSRSPSRVKADVKEWLAAEGATPEKVDRIAQSIIKAGTVHPLAFQGKVFEPEIAAMLNREFATDAARLRRWIVQSNNTLKAARLGFDWGLGQLQLLPTFFISIVGVKGLPRTTWANAQIQSIKAMVKPHAFGNYVRANQDLIREAMQYGMGVGRLQDHMVGLGKGSPITKVPIIGTAAEAFGRQFQTALDIAKIEMYKAWRPLTPEKELFQLVQTIESLTMSGRMEGGMVSHYRSLIERVLLLAPAYYRGAVNLVAAMGEKGVSGSIARRSMLSFAAGLPALYIGIGLMLGMSWDELKERLDPRSSEFMLWRVRIGDNEFNLGPGGIYRSFVKLIGSVIKTASNNPGDFDRLTSEDNPFARWLRSHGSPFVELTWTGITGSNFLGDRKKGRITAMALSLLPLSAQAESVPDTVVQFFGGQSFLRPRTVMDVARERGYKKLDDVPLNERRDIAKELKEGREFDRDDSTRAAERAIRQTTENAERMEKALPSSSKAFLKKNGLVIKPITYAITRSGVRISLSSDERESLETAFIEAYSQEIEHLARSGWEPTQEQLDKRLERARERTRKAFVRQMLR